jgi:hypothetical protein
MPNISIPSVKLSDYNITKQELFTFWAEARHALEVARKEIIQLKARLQQIEQIAKGEAMEEVDLTRPEAPHPDPRP